jgi:hypothetical protein
LSDDRRVNADASGAGCRDAPVDIDVGAKDMTNARPGGLCRGAVYVAAALLAGCGGGGGGEFFQPQASQCPELASLVAASFPVQPTTITMAKLNAAGSVLSGTTALPEHCQVQGTIESRTGTDGVLYGTKFEVRLPIAWNGRFLFQGGGGTEGSLPVANGSVGSGAPALAQGYAVMTQNGGHDNTLLSSGPAFALDAKAQVDYGYRSVDVSTQTAKYLMNSFYRRGPEYSYAVGCSTGGKQGMNLSQMFPAYYDGIVAGDPIYNQGANTLSETNALQAIAAIVTQNPNGTPRYFESFTPATDYPLVTSAILNSCDALDGLTDGVVDNWQACKFDPATYVFPNGEPLQCAGAKTPTCLTAAQVGAIKRINIGPRKASGAPLLNPFKPDNTTVAGYMYDGGFMANSGVPGRDIGTATSQPGNLGFAAVQIPYMWLSPPQPSFDPLAINYDSDMAKVAVNSPMVSNSADLSAFKARKGKIIYYHGQSDPGPPVLHTVAYYERLMAVNGGLAPTKDFARLFLIPNMGHCSGGPSTDKFDPLAAIAEWVEKGKAPDQIAASGTAFATAPTSRSRPLCPYPTYAAYTGLAGGDISLASNYTCKQ